MKWQPLNRLIHVAPLRLSVLTLALAAGCSSSDSGRATNIENPRTGGERMLYEAKRMETKGEMMVRAERLIANGRGKREEGETLKNQGKTVTGERISAEGDAMIREGEAVMEKARAMNTKAPGTQPRGE